MEETVFSKCCWNLFEILRGKFPFRLPNENENKHSKIMYGFHSVKFLHSCAVFVRLRGISWSRVLLRCPSPPSSARVLSATHGQNEEPIRRIFGIIWE